MKAERTIGSGGAPLERRESSTTRLSSAPPPLRVLTVHQPYASLIALGVKGVETRSKSTSYRGPVAIHAAKGYTADDVAVYEKVASWGVLGPWDELPRGVVIATVELAACEPVTDRGTACIAGIRPWELHVGDYSASRWTWHLAAPRRLATPVVARGALGLWRADDQLAAEIRHEVARG